MNEYGKIKITFNDTQELSMQEIASAIDQRINDIRRKFDDLHRECFYSDGISEGGQPLFDYKQQG